MLKGWMWASETERKESRWTSGFGIRAPRSCPYPSRRGQWMEQRVLWGKEKGMRVQQPHCGPFESPQHPREILIPRETCMHWQLWEDRSWRHTLGAVGPSLLLRATGPRSECGEKSGNYGPGKTQCWVLESWRRSAGRASRAARAGIQQSCKVQVSRANQARGFQKGRAGPVNWR